MNINNTNTINNLIQYNLVRNSDKNKTYTQSGGNLSKLLLDIPNVETNLLNISNIYDKNNIFLEEDIFPKKKYLEYLEILKSTTKKIGKEFGSYVNMVHPIAPFVTGTQITKENISKNSINYYDKYILGENNSKTFNYYIKKYNVPLIIKYPFSSFASLRFYDILNENKLINPDSKIVIYSKGVDALDAIIYYSKYKLYKYDPKKITYYIYNNNPMKVNDKYINSYLKKVNIDRNNIDNQITNKYLSSQKNKIKNSKLVIIDMNILIKLQPYIRQYTFQTIFSILVMTLNTISLSGSVVIYMPVISSKMALNFFTYMSKYFEKSVIKNEEIVEPGDHWQFIIYKGYKGGIEKDYDKLYKINEENFVCDPTGGHMYKITDDELNNKLGNNDKNAKCYLQNFIKIDETKIIKFYKKFKKSIKNAYDEKIDLLFQINNLYNNPNSVSKIFENNMYYAISYVKQIGLQIPEWVDNDKFYDKVFRNIYSTLDSVSYKYNRKCPDVIVYEEELEYSNESYLNSLYAMSENVYQYIDKFDKNKIKRVENTFNFYQKKLEKFLFVKYNININEKYVSRAWIKMYELYDDVKYFDNLGDNVKAFHVCEAPGNFINASIYYTKNKTKIKKYDWNALSLKNSNIFDEYGFIKKTINQWDFGKDNQGNILNHDNLIYYYEKYKGVDSVIGDCGVAWSEFNNPIVNLDVYQMMYALMIPRIGGNFVVKTFASNFNLQFLSFLYIAKNKFNKLQIFKSSRNIWSPEIYIVGIGSKGFSQEEINIFFKISENMSKGIVSYPVSYINSECAMEHEFYVGKIIENYVEIKKFFVYLAQNDEFYKSVKPDIENMLDNKNIIWLEKHMGHLNGAVAEYKKYRYS